MPSRDQFTTEIYVNNQQAQDALKELNKKSEPFLLWITGEAYNEE